MKIEQVMNMLALINLDDNGECTVAVVPNDYYADGQGDIVNGRVGPDPEVESDVAVVNGVEMFVETAEEINDEELEESAVKRLLQQTFIVQYIAAS